jgi:acyl-CoA synthetase (AMP-forming)/AMP-acid ligase II
MGSTDSLTYLISTLALVKAGYVPACISPRNSPAAISNFIQKGDIKHFVLGKEPEFSQVFQAGLELLAQEAPSHSTPSVSSFFAYPDFVNASADTDDVSRFKLKSSDLYCFFHSSGQYSTSRLSRQRSR